MRVLIIAIIILAMASVSQAYIGISVGPFINALFQPGGASTFGGTVAYKGLPIVEPYGGVMFRYHEASGLFYGALVGSYFIFYDLKGIAPHVDLCFQYEKPPDRLYNHNHYTYANIGAGVHLNFHPRITPVISGGMSVSFYELPADPPFRPQAEKVTSYFGYLNYTVQINL